MRVLVFGRTGQLGRELAALAGPDLDIAALGREAADLTDAAACAAAVAETGADAVINAAAFTAVDRAEAEEAAATRINAEAPAAMAAAAAARGLPFLHVSTDYVFSGVAGRPWREDDAPGPLSAYGRSKLAGERAVMAAHPQAVILRTAWVFSAHGSNFVKTMLRLAAGRERLRVVDDQKGGPTPAAAIAEALIAIARARLAGAGAPGIFHFAGTPAVSWCGFAREILARAGLSTPVDAIASAEFPTPARRPANSVLDCARIRTVYGIAQPDWREGLDAVLDRLGAA
ncbi:MAG: dTDP-4-dehydrorhamnose reductase [Alphaproteobacteria bacterium]|nr:MAG: dTDP-4-dehydrorhamnose reductase [Alphaproteobacteria bacterium]